MEDGGPNPSGNGREGEIEADLVARAKGGDTAAFEALVHRNTKLVLSLAVRLVGNREDAEELAQETFIRAYRSIGSFEGTARFSTWIYRIAMNLCLNHLRRSRWRGFLGLDETAEIQAPDPSPHQQVSAGQVQERMRKALAALPAKQRATVALKAFHDKSHEEIAQIMGCTVGTSKANYFHGVQKLKKALVEGESS